MFTEGLRMFTEGIGGAYKRLVPPINQALAGSNHVSSWPRGVREGAYDTKIEARNHNGRYS